MILKIHFIIVSFFVLILSIIIVSYALLSYGITLPHLVLPNFKAEQLYIKLDKKLIFQAKRIDVTLSNSSLNRNSLLEVPKILSILDFCRRSFESFKVDELYLDGQKVTFSYTDHPLSPLDNSLGISSEEISVSILYRVYEDHIVFDVPYSMYKTGKVLITGKAFYDFKEKKAYSKFTLSLPDCADLKLYAKGNGQRLAFTATSTTAKDLAPLVKFFKLKKSISKWIVDYNKADSYKLLQAKGIYSYTDPDLILQTLFLHAKEKELAYTFNESLHPVISNEADVYFTKGVLDIQPHNASYNKHIIDKGGVKIDFRDKQVGLEVDLNMHTTLDQDIVDIVQAYHIPFPLLQEKGKSEARLKIFINLSTQKAYAKGRFFIKKSELILNGVRYKINNASIRLNKNILSIDTIKLAYEDMFLSKAHGQMDLEKLMGDIFFDIESVLVPFSSEKKIKLLSKNKQLQLNFSENSQSFILPQTLWSFDEQNITVEPTSILRPTKFSHKSYIKDLNIHIKDLVDLKVNGNFDLRRQYANLDISSSKFRYLNKDLNISAKDSVTPFILVHENNTTQIHTLSTSHIYINENQVDVMPTSLSIKDGYLHIKETEVSFNDKFSSKISSHYELGSKRAKIRARETMLYADKLLFIEPAFNLFYKNKKGKHYIDINEYGIHALVNEKKELDIRLNDFSKLYPYSKTMQLYDIKNGHADLTIIEDHIGMDLMITDFHPLLSKDGKDIKSYSIKGDYRDKTANLQINKSIDFLYHKKAKLTAKSTDFNLFPIMDYLKIINTNDEKSDLDILIKTKKCNVSLGSQRMILADSLKINIKGDTINAQLIHDKGGVLFESHDKSISVFGHYLNDKFMNGLFKFSTFKGGELSFVMQGPIDDMDGIINIKKTVIKDYTVLNNTLAFFNTIPSLVTFSVPDYSKSGLYVEEMYSAFHKTGPKIKIRDTKLTSEELVITAEGGSDFDAESIDLLLQVKTDLGSSAKNIPILGYIIFGEDSVSTTVRVHGPLSDPKVESSVAKSIIAAPFNIIKRTLFLPFTSLGLFDEDNNTSQKK